VRAEPASLWQFAYEALWAVALDQSLRTPAAEALEALADRGIADAVADAAWLVCKRGPLCRP
jgi:hypothetical protein